MYAVLVTLCFIEMVDFMAFGTGPMCFVPMAIEYPVYIGLSVRLLRAARMRRQFRLRAG
jgi:hypothetical protein